MARFVFHGNPIFFLVCSIVQSCFFFGATIRIFFSSSMVHGNEKDSIFSVIVKLPFMEATNFSKNWKMKIVSILTKWANIGRQHFVVGVCLPLLFAAAAAASLFFCHSAAVSPTICHSIWKFSYVSLGVRCQIYVHSILFSLACSLVCFPIVLSFVCSLKIYLQCD